ncbi:hypothetical protein OAQ84_01670, partial [Bdellovibrionales bacterium]|nr:hypothetical protein [Bdellovibrionales bacterium]
GDVDITAKDLGVFAMFEFPILLRVWANYVFDATAAVSGISDTTGTALKLGVGYTGLPFVSLNFEIVKRNYTERGSSTIDLTSDTYFVSVGLPLP